MLNANATGVLEPLLQLRLTNMVAGATSTMVSRKPANTMTNHCSRTEFSLLSSASNCFFILFSLLVFLSVDCFFSEVRYARLMPWGVSTFPFL